MSKNYMNRSHVAGSLWLGLTRTPRRTLQGSIRIKCDQLVDELLNVRLVCWAHHANCGRPLHAMDSPAPLLS
jgi:hypothetical protein